MNKVFKPAIKIEDKILVIRGNKVILDSDLAKIYGVSTKVLNQAIKRHADRFPKDFAFLLTSQEVTSLKSQIVTSSSLIKGIKIRISPFAVS
jgi:hypothetical protein